jgi:hypothetical protein
MAKTIKILDEEHHLLSKYKARFRLKTLGKAIKQLIEKDLEERL